MPHTPFSQNPLFYPYTTMYSRYARSCSPYEVFKTMGHLLADPLDITLQGLPSYTFVPMSEVE